MWGQANKRALDPNHRDAQNLLEAASSGAAVSVKVVSNIAANLIAFLAVLAFINSAFSWLGNMVDIQGLSFQVQPAGLLACGGDVLGSGWWVDTQQAQGTPGPSRASSPVPHSAPLLLPPTPCGFLDGRVLGGLPGGGGAAGDQVVPE